MGGGPDQENLLIILWDPEPTHIIDEIKRRFPYFEITYFQLDRTQSGEAWGKDSARGVPSGTFSLSLLWMRTGLGWRMEGTRERGGEGKREQS